MKLSSKYGILSMHPFNKTSAIKRGLSILECFTKKKHYMSLSEINRNLNLPKSSLYRALNTLCGLNYLKFDSENKKYYLGPRVLSLGFSVLQSLRIREIARPYLKELSRDCDKTVNLAMLDNVEMVYIDRIEVHDLRDVHFGVGDRIPLCSSAAGRAVLAFLESEKLTEIIGGLKHGPNNFKAEIQSHLFQTLEEIRTKGFAVNDQEVAVGISAIAAPVLAPKAEHYAISIVAGSDVESIAELVTKYSEKIVKTSKQISEAMGFNVGDS